MVSIDDIRRILYMCYNHIIYRCNNKNCECYYRYGGRGIKNNFKDFDDFYNYNEALYLEALKVTDKPTIDRIDNNGHYEKGNIRWVSMKEQSLNRCTTVYIKIVKEDGDWCICNNIKNLCERFRTNWSHISNIISSKNTLYGLEIDRINDISTISNEELSYRINKYNKEKFYIEQYKIEKENSVEIVNNLKEWARKNNEDPSYMYKICRGLRKPKRIKISKIIVEV